MYILTISKFLMSSTSVWLLFLLSVCLCDSLSSLYLFALPLRPSMHPGALQIEMSEESDQGKYECVATNRDGTRYSTPANLYVRGKSLNTFFMMMQQF